MDYIKLRFVDHRLSRFGTYQGNDSVQANDLKSATKQVESHT